jgi:hypothetical protein
LSVEFVPLAVHVPVFLFGALSEQIVAAPEKRNLEASNFGSVQSQMVRQHVEKRGAVRAQPSAPEAAVPMTCCA